jgi:gluconokinase
MPLRAPQPPLVLAIDVGTSSARAIVYDAAGCQVEGASAQAEYPLHVSPDGAMEVDAATLLGTTAGLLDTLAAQVPGPFAAVEAVAISTFWHSVVGVDAAGQAITPVLLWGDTRARAAARALRERLDERAVHARTGCVLHPTYLPAKLRWLADSQPEAFRRARWWLSFGEYLYLHLFGEPRVSLSMASGSGLLDQHTRAWDPAVLAAVPVEPARLAPLADAPFDGLRPPYAARWPALRARPWYPAHGDGACSNVGSGCVTPQRWALMIGTSGALRTAWRAADTAIPWGVWTYRVDANRFLAGGALNDGGNLLEWLHETLRLGWSARLKREVAALPPDGHGLTILPLFGGERSPGWATDARGAIVGLTLATRPVDLIRAGLEAVALRFALLARILGGVLPVPDQVVATGGGLLRSPHWIQIIADALGRPVVASAEPEGSSRGAALLALEQLGVLASVESAPAALGRAYAPDPVRHARYQAALDRQQALYRQLVQNTASQ